MEGVGVRVSGVESLVWFGVEGVGFRVAGRGVARCEVEGVRVPRDARLLHILKVYESQFPHKAVNSGQISDQKHF